MYSLSPQSPDEKIAWQVLHGESKGVPRPDAVLCVVDASNLERNLFLVTQVMELGLPVLVALNMVDMAEAKGIHLRPQELSQKLGVPLFPLKPIEERDWSSCEQLWGKVCIDPDQDSGPCPSACRGSRADRGCVAGIPSSGGYCGGESLELLAGSNVGPEGARKLAAGWRERFRKEAYDWPAAVIHARYEYVRNVLGAAGVLGGSRIATWTDRIDAIVLHPVAGWGVLAGMMMTLFISIFSIASYPMEWIDAGFSWTGLFLEQHMPAGVLRELLVNGVVAGVGGVVIFLPQILILFFFLGLLEDSGYLARAAFLLDRVMHRVGLSGKSFIPLLSSYACAIPGLWQHERWRILRIGLRPF